MSVGCLSQGRGRVNPIQSRTRNTSEPDLGAEPGAAVEYQDRENEELSLVRGWHCEGSLDLVLLYEQSDDQDEYRGYMGILRIQ